MPNCEPGVWNSIPVTTNHKYACMPVARHREEVIMLYFHCGINLKITVCLFFGVRWLVFWVFFSLGWGFCVWFFGFFWFLFFPSEGNSSIVGVALFNV